MKRREFSLLAIALGAAPALPAAAAGPQPVTVRIKNFAFVPVKLTITAGTTVVFVNDDDEPHTATAANKAFDSEAIDTKKSWKHAFARPGTFAYYCELHPQMRGQIVVTAAARATT